jgi:hypothetical protein
MVQAKAKFGVPTEKPCLQYLGTTTLFIPVSSLSAIYIS